MFGSILFFTLLYFVYSSASNLPMCPYPLAENIEPCSCGVDEKYRMILTCNIDTEFTEESFNRVTESFDYNNAIYSFDIDTAYNNKYYKFYPQLNATNIGKLNITLFSLMNAELPEKLFGDGAFDGSAGSIQNITVQNSKSGTNGSIDLGSHFLHPACSTLQSLKLERISQLSSTSLTNAPYLQEVSFERSMFPIIPSSLFSTENVPNIQSIPIGVLDNLNLQTDAFKDLPELTSLEISANQIDIIQSYALNDLPNLQSLELTGINILRIEEDAFKDLTSLKAFEISDSDIEELPRIFSNSPNLTTFSLTKSKLKIVDENAFSGVPFLEYLNLNYNSKLLELVLTNMNLTTIQLEDAYELSTLDLSKFPKLTSVSLGSSNALSYVSLDNLPTLTSLVIATNQNEPLSINITNCTNLNTISTSQANLVKLSLQNVDALTTLNFYSNTNLNHTGLGSSLHSIINSEAYISLQDTNVKNLDEFVFRPLLETFTSVDSASGYIDMQHVSLDCGCDVKWIIVDFHFQTKFFRNARCRDGTYLADVDPILLEMMCPP